jgi:hypothetical protein
MITELVLRFVLGGIIVCVFAVIGDMLKPKRFAGIFGAAPSVALATLGLTFFTHGGSYAGLEGRSMLAGSAALFAYSLLTGWWVLRDRPNTILAASASGAAWFAVAFGLWGAFLQ